MKIHTLVLGDYQTNCYILQGSDDRCLVIDPGYEPQRILAYLEQHQLTCQAILLTHGHFDHVGGVKTLVAELDCPVYLHEKELTLPPVFTAGKLYYTDLYDEGAVLELAGLTVRVLHTPGHTPGSVCLLTEDALISGDTLFAGSCGRTDLPGGDWATIRASLLRLRELDDSLSVYPGHGESTVLAEEKLYNPYLR